MYRQSAVLPYRGHGEDLEVLLVTSRRGKHWILPKGIVEPGLSAAESAAKEALEEAGVVGDIAEAPLDSYRYQKWGGTCEVEVFPFRVRGEMDEWAESGIRRRRWSSLAKALRRVEDDQLRSIIARLPDAAKPTGETMHPGRRRPPASSPPRLIYLFRHAKSRGEDADLEDFDRPLAPKGELACVRM
ncbi:MAG: NUDIX domain-containing protein, partial [Actinomycetota bacterium]|nr:NUDIX domain-containing protein [Actinomycetota bacterium]